MFAKGIQCATVLTLSLITLYVTIPSLTLQHRETSSIIHLTSRDQKRQHAKQGQQQLFPLSNKISPDQPARSVKSSLSLCKPRLSLSFPSPIFRLRFRISVGLTFTLARPHSSHPWHASAVGRRDLDRECGSSIDYDIGRLLSRMEGSKRTIFEVPCLRFACDLFVVCCE